MANTTILLREDIEHVGGRGEIVKVKAGYARNYLLPHGFATLATKGNVKQIEQERSALLKKAAIEKATAEAQREQMESITLKFERKSGENDQLFGSVTSGGNAPLGVENLGGAVEAYLSTHFSGFPNGVPPPGLYHRILKEIEVPLLTHETDGYQACIT